MRELFHFGGDFWISSGGVDTKIPLAPAVILFGPNDSGKTNSLLSIGCLLRGQPTPRRDLMRDNARGAFGLDIALDLERFDHRELLAHVARAGLSIYSPVFRIQGRRILLRELSADDDAPDSEPQFLAQSLSEAVHEWVRTADDVPGDADSVAAQLLQSITLCFRGGEYAAGDEVFGTRHPSHVSWQHSSLRVEIPSREGEPSLDGVAASDVENELFGTTIDLPSGALSSLVDVVTSHDFERSLDKDKTVADQVLRLAGWERYEEGAMTDEWFYDPPDGSDESEFVYRGDPWYDDYSGLPSDDVLGACKRVSELATRIAPRFVTRDYRIELQALAPHWWYLNEGSRLRIALVPREVESGGLLEMPSGFNLDAVGSGLRVWTTFAVYEALRRQSLASDRATLFIFDEPERHLHPTAQREAAAFLADIVGEGARAMVATHSPAFLNEDIPDACYVRVSRSGGKTVASTLNGGRLTAIEASLSKLGMTRADLIQLIRGVLLVEGAQDRLVVEAFFGPSLADAHIRVLTIRGTDNSLALLDADILRALDVPIFLMLDHTRTEFVEEVARGRLARAATKEERALAALAVELRDKSFEVTNVPLNVPDIVWALPEAAVKRTAPRFPGWKQATEDLKKHRGAVNPKTFLRDQYGLAVTTRSLADITALAHQDGLEASAELKGAIARVLR